ncbi:MAG: hypothetical protein HQ567_21930, partial [Candidatus Nealsonbacteria bacterium]|nr:hypothetical protein [Candidatus Nealsonbacteria bacterium]
MRQSYSLLLVVVLLLCCGNTASADLVGWWSFDESAGTVAADVSSSTNQHDAALLGAATFAPGEGQFGGAMWLDGSTGTFAEVLDHADVEFLDNESFAISMWYKRDGVENDQGLITKGYQDAPRDPGGYYLLQTRLDGFTIDSREGAGANPRSRVDDNSDVSHGDNQWHHFVVVRDSTAGELRLYVDNQSDPQVHDMVAAGTGDWAMGVHDQTLVFGDHNDRYTQGYFDDIAIWKGNALTTTQIDTLFTTGVDALVNNSLVWDNGGPGEWADLRWLDAGTPGNTTNALLNASNTATIDVGFVGTPVVREAFSLTVDNGSVAVKDGSTLNVVSSVAFAPGTSLSLGSGASLAVGQSGTIGDMQIATTATIDVGGGLAISSLSDGGAAATLIKTGVGTAQLAAVSAVAGSKLKVDAGTLVVTGNAAGVGSADFVLNGGVMQLDGIDVLGAAPDGAVGNWRFEEASGITAVNTANPGVNEGTMVLMDDSNRVPGKIGNALAFDGAEEYVQISQDVGLPIYNNGTDNAYSIAMWVKGGPQSDRRVFAEASTTGTTQLFNVGVNNSGESLKMFIRTDGGGANPNKATNGSAFDDIWHHIVWVDEDGAGKVYIDGVLDSQTFNYTRGTLTSLDTTTIGAILRGDPTGATHHFNGLIDEVYVYNEALTAAEIYDMGASEAILPTTDVTVSASSTLDVNATVAELGALALNNGILTVSGGQTSFTGTTLADGDVRVGLALETPTDLGNALTGSADLTFAVAGTGTTQIVDSYTAGPSNEIAFAGTSMTGATIEAANGNTVIVGTTPWAGSTEALLSGGRMTITPDISEIAPVVPAGALSQYTFDSAATPGADVTGNAHDLELMRQAAYTASGKYGGALLLDGDGDYAIDADAGDYLNGLPELTVAMWINLEGDPPFDKGFWEMKDNGNSDLWGARYDANGDGSNQVIKTGMTLDTSPGNNSNDDQYVSSDFVQTTDWQHVTLTWKDGEGMKLYLDGIEDGPATREMVNTSGVLAQID